MADIITSISLDNLKAYVVKQLNTFFPDGRDVDVQDSDLDKAFKEGLKRLGYCFSHISLASFHKLDEDEVDHPFFQHTNSDQYCIFLYYLSNSLWKINPEKSWIADKLILLNKTLHACWYTYKVELPDIFIVVHPVGSVIGHAAYSNYLVICQNVTIGNRYDVKDKIGEYCFLSTGATIMGEGKIGNKVSIGVNTTVYKEDIPDNHIIYFDSKIGKNVLKENKKDTCAADFYFKD